MSTLQWIQLLSVILNFAPNSSGHPSENLKYSILLKKLKDPRFLIVENGLIQVDHHSSAQNADKLRALLHGIWKNNPYCPVEYKVEKMENCIPDTINYVILKEGKRENGCTPVTRRIRYLEASEYNKDFEQKVYQIKSKEFVVAYIATKSD